MFTFLQGLLSFLSAPLIGALSDVWGRKFFLLITVFFTCAPIPLMTINTWWVVLWIVNYSYSVHIVLTFLPSVCSECIVNHLEQALECMPFLCMLQVVLCYDQHLWCVCCHLLCCVCICSWCNRRTGALPGLWIGKWFSECVTEIQWGYATMNECYSEQFLSTKSGSYTEYRCYNERGGILSANVAQACAWSVGPSRFD